MADQTVEAELQRRDAGNTLVAWKLVADADNTDTGLSDPVVDQGARDRLDTLAASLSAILTELGQKLEAGQEVALDAASLAALESVTAAISNFPSEYPLPAAQASALGQDATLQSLLTEVAQKLEAGDEVALDAATLAALESITATIANFPTEYPLPAAQVTTLTPQTDALTDAELRATPVDVSLAATERDALAALTFSETLTALGSHTTSWVEVLTYEWLDITAKMASTAAVSAVLEFTDAADPNTTPPGVDDVTRDLTVTLAGSALEGLDEPSFGIPAQMRWARITVTDVTGGQDIDVSTFGSTQVGGNALLPLATTLQASFRAALTRSVLAGKAPDGSYDDVPLDGTLSTGSSETSGALPSGSLPAWDPVGPIVAANVIDTGWLEAEQWNYQSFHATFDIAGVKVFLMDAEDDQGNGSIYNVLQFASPTGTSKGPGSSVEAAAPFFNNYFRVVIINDSGSTANVWNYRSQATAVQPGAVFLSIDQPILDFFPAPIVQAIIKGQQPDGDYEALPISGSDDGNTTTTPLVANDTFVGTGRDTTGYLGGMVVVESDQVSATDGLCIEFSEDENFAHIHRTIKTTYTDTGNGQTLLYPVMQGEYYRVRYTNGGVDQTEFVLRTELLSSAAQSPMGSLNEDIDGTRLATVSRSSILAPNDADEWDNVSRGTEGLRVSVHEHEAKTPPATSDDFVGHNLTAATTAGIGLTASNAMANRTGVIIINEESNRNLHIASSTARIDGGAYAVIPPGKGVHLPLNANVDIAVQASSSTVEYSIIEVAEVSSD